MMILNMLIAEDENTPPDFAKAVSIVEHYHLHARNHAMKEDITSESFHIAAITTGLKHIFSTCPNKEEFCNVRDMISSLLVQIDEGAMEFYAKEKEEEPEEGQPEEVH